MPATASAASPAAFTTDVNGVKVNANHYANKCDVYLNGGPDGAQLADGNYVFFVMNPSGQADPNGPNKLSSDSNANRTFSVSGGVVTYAGAVGETAHATSNDTTDGDLLIQLCQYANTSNNGGVYIVAICPEANQTPSGCKYDAFKVRSTDGTPGEPGGDDLTAIKSATPSFTRTYDHDVDKSVDRTYVQQTGGTATFNYQVAVTRDAGTDSAFIVSGQITVFNTNDEQVTGVSVSDNILVITDEVCTVTGGSTTIAANDSAIFNYTCTLPTATASTSGTNEATVTWNQASVDSPTSSATAQAPFDFSTATPSAVGACTTVTDSFSGSAPTVPAGIFPAEVCASNTISYSRTISVVPNCVTYNDTATISSGENDSVSVTVCGRNADGFTMGFWSNKNGQRLIGDNAGALCTYLGAYSSVLTLPATCNSTTLKKYVLDVIKAAEASGDGVPMFKGQFLATALSAYFSPSLASTGVVVPGSLLGTANCITVSQLLTAANASFSTLSANKANVNTVKDVFDRINNNRQQTCLVV